MYLKKKNSWLQCAVRIRWFNYINRNVNKEKTETSLPINPPKGNQTNLLKIITQSSTKEFAFNTNTVVWSVSFFVILLRWSRLSRLLCPIFEYWVSGIFSAGWLLINDNFKSSDKFSFYNYLHTTNSQIYIWNIY